MLRHMEYYTEDNMDHERARCPSVRYSSNASLTTLFDNHGWMHACFDNDASACYDRMIPSIVMIKCRRAGMSKAAAQVVLTLLHQMKYHIRTAYSISTEAFSNAIDWILVVM
jgi:hypothetical protein